MLVTRSCSRPAGNADWEDAGSDGLKTTWSEQKSGGYQYSSMSCLALAENDWHEAID